MALRSLKTPVLLVCLLGESQITCQSDTNDEFVKVTTSIVGLIDDDCEAERLGPPGRKTAKLNGCTSNIPRLLLSINFFRDTCFKGLAIPL